MTQPKMMRVLVTGASGYVGGRLVPELLARGHAARCAVRDTRKLDAAPWRADLAGDLSDARRRGRDVPYPASATAPTGAGLAEYMPREAMVSTRDGGTSRAVRGADWSVGTDRR